MGFAKGDVVAGRFEIIRQIGAGGLAEVFLARDRVTGAEVALKALHAHLLFDEGLKERFRRELAVTRQLDHPGIVRVYDLYEAEGRPFFAMELLRGETLAERLRSGPLDSEEARRIASDVCEALTAAHKKGIVHRDLKPQNIFLAETGGDRPQTKLLDFGLARAAGWARLTAQSTVLGTPGYAAPEVIAGGGSDPRSDLYSLAATLFEMLTGSRAFPSADPYQALRRQRGAAPSPRALNKSVSAEVDAMVRRGLDADPEQRFADAAQMGEALSTGRAPELAPVPPAMTAGNWRLVVHARPEIERKDDKTNLHRLLSLLGVESSWASRRWVERVLDFGSAPMLEGCSRETAQSISVLCQERGVAAAVEQDLPKKDKRLIPRIAFGSAFSVSMMQLLYQLAQVRPNSVFSGPVLAMMLVGGGGAIAGWLAYVRSRKAPLKNLPRGDPAVRRLLDGILRRAARLEAREKNAPLAVQYLRDDLVRAAKELVVEAEALGARAAAIPDDLAPLTPLPIGSAPPDDVPTLIRAGKPEERDLLVGQLLEIAAALDEALAASSTSKEAAAKALTRLREETTFAKKVIPEIEATLRGEPIEDPAVQAVLAAGSAQLMQLPGGQPPRATPVPLNPGEPRVRDR